MVLKIDEYDKKILSILDDNSRERITHIAKKVRLAKETVNYRINRLIRRGLIKKFSVIINTSKLGFSYYKFFFKFKDTDPKKERDFIIFMRQKKNCSNLRFTEGKYDVVFLMMFKTIGEFEELYEEMTNNFGIYIRKKSFHAVTRSHKFHNKIFKEDEGEQRILEHTQKGSIRLDDTDNKLMSKLIRDPKAKLTEISNITNIPPKVLSYHLKNLEKKGIISAFTIDVNIYKFEYEFVFFNISLNNHDKSNTIIEFFRNNSMISLAYRMIGEFDLCLEINVKNDYELRNLIDKFKTEFKGYFNECEILRIFRDYDTNWSPLEDTLIA